jgi:hypothetical protein
MDFYWELKSKERSDYSHHIVGEVVLLIDKNKIIDSVLDLSQTRVEWEQLGKSILQNKPFFAYPFICSCGEGECTGISVEFNGLELKIESNLAEIVLPRSEINSFLESLSDFFGKLT